MKTNTLKSIPGLFAIGLLLFVVFAEISCEDESTNLYTQDSLVHLYKTFELDFSLGCTSKKYYSDGTTEKIWGGGYAFGITYPTVGCDFGNLSTCWSDQVSSGHAIFHFYKNKTITAELTITRSLSPTWTYEEMTCLIDNLPQTDSTGNFLKYYASDGYKYIRSFSCKRHNDSSYPYEEVDSTFSNDYSALICFYK